MCEYLIRSDNIFFNLLLSVVCFTLSLLIIYIRILHICMYIYIHVYICPHMNNSLDISKDCYGQHLVYLICVQP
jgi:hypothetical protein